MTDRDWEKELAEIDRRIAAQPAEAEVPPAAVVPAPALPKSAKPRAASPASTVPNAPNASSTVARRHWTATAGLLVRLLFTALLLAAVVVWPYANGCGPWLVAYLATIGVAMLSALWTAVASWRHRGPLVHVLALGLFAAAGVYGAMEILPRVGYAVPSPAHPATWACK